MYILLDEKKKIQDATNHSTQLFLYSPLNIEPVVCNVKLHFHMKIVVKLDCLAAPDKLAAFLCILKIIFNTFENSTHHLSRTSK